MPQRLLIVESPNKIAKLRGFLGPGWTVAASYGHVRDLPPVGGLSVRFAAGRVEPAYQPMEKAANAIAQLRRAAADADEVWLATDPDREGEAIAWHLSELLGPRPYQRAVFHAITASAVQAAVAKPRAIDRHLVDAQQARRVLDRVVGWLVSPTLRRLGPEARSAGRVQSVALRIIAEREAEIAAFAGTDYFTLDATLERPGTPPPFKARLVEWKGEPLDTRLRDRVIADKSVDWCRKQPWLVQACERREQARHAPPPFTTATVQQAASVRLKLAPDATMKLLQTLFEGGHITYHRTDATVLAPEAIAAARAIISEQYSARYLPAQPIIHQSKAGNAQEAHEAIRPTHPESGAAALGDGADGKLYRLIWERFIACQMQSGRDQLTTIDVACAPDGFARPNGHRVAMGVYRAKGRVVLFDGWRKLGGDATDEAKKRGRKKKGDEDDDESDTELPLLNPGDAVELRDLAASERHTKPPPRYTQAALIKRLERDGIGRPSTYAAILKTLFDRTYVREEKRLLHATDLGRRVIDFLVRHYAGNFIELDFTARMEDALDKVARGESAWEPLVTQAANAVLTLAQKAGLRGNPLTEV